MSYQDVTTKRVLHCTALVGRQRRMVARLRARAEGSPMADDRTIANAERLLLSFERALMAMLRTRRSARHRGEAEGHDSSFERYHPAA